MRLSLLIIVSFVIIYAQLITADELPGLRIHVPENRRQTIITLSAIRKGPLTLSRLLIDPKPNEGAELEARNLVETIENVTDVDDFRVALLIRFWHLTRNRGNLSEKTWDDIRRVLLGFRYYYGKIIDKPRPDSRWYDSENHMLCFHSDEYLAGELFPNEIFRASGKTGTWHRNRARADILKWIHERALRGFTEFDSNTYYNIDLLSLANLYDFAKDKEIKQKAGMAIDLILADMVVDSFRGIYGTPHGRAHARYIFGNIGEPTRPIQWLLFGTASPYEILSYGALSLATSTYSPPAVIVSIACDSTSSFEHIERHPLVVKRTYRTPDYMLSGLLSEAVGPPTEDLLPRDIVQKPPNRVGQVRQKFIHSAIPGRSSYQVHAWQATLGKEVIAFTSQPATFDIISKPNMWCGQYACPKIFQHKSVLVALHNLDAAPKLPDDIRLHFSHAYFPRDNFDQVIEKNNWIIGQKGDGYLALYCAIPYDWAPGSLYADREIRAYGTRNAWICQMGRKAIDGDFEEFVSRVTAAKVIYNPQEPGITYNSPREGKISVYWDQLTTINGKKVNIPNNWRFRGPFAESKHMSGYYRFQYGDEVLELDFNR